MYAAHAHGKCSQFQNNLADNKFRQERSANLTKKLIFLEQKLRRSYIGAQDKRPPKLPACLPDPTCIALCCQLFSSAFSSLSRNLIIGGQATIISSQLEEIRPQRVRGQREDHPTSHCRKCFEEATRSAKQTP